MLSHTGSLKVNTKMQTTFKPVLSPLYANREEFTGQSSVTEVHPNISADFSLLFVVSCPDSDE